MNNHKYEIKKFEKEEKIICVALTNERPHIFYKELNEEIKNRNKSGFLFLDFQKCNDSEDRFFKVPFGNDGVKWSKLKKLPDNELTEDFINFCNLTY